MTVATRVAVVALLVGLWSPHALAQLASCRGDAERIANALAEIRRSIDPCGESAEVFAVLQQFERCAERHYQICTSSGIARNVFDRSGVASDDGAPRTIQWNPELRSELEPTCAGDPTKPLQRHPTASLLHELVHAVQDCAGLNPGEHELEAVRIENIYRRAAGLCQRRGYGDDPLPQPMLRSCNVVRSCSCAAPPDASAKLPEALLRAAGERGSSPASEPEPHERNGDRPE